jgi:hypothetical protein
MSPDECSSGRLRSSLALRLTELDGRIAAEQARPLPNQALLRRLRRERLLARDRMAAAAGWAMPRWAQDAQPKPA